jgi:hypothetical protein
VRWVIVTIFLLGMISTLNWFEAEKSERRIAFGLMAIAAFVLAAVLATTAL